MTVGHLPTSGFVLRQATTAWPPEGDPMQAYLGTTLYQDRAVSLFQTPQGIVMLPAVDAATPTNLDRRLTSVGALSRAMEETPTFKQALAGTITKEKLVEQFGSLQLSNGQTIEQAVAVLPQGAKYETGTALLGDLAQRIAGAVQSTTGLAKQLAASTNVPGGAKSIGDADISSMKSLSPDAVGALRRAGITTIAQVASTDPAKVASVLREANVPMSAGELAAVRGNAQTLSIVATR